MPILPFSRVLFTTITTCSLKIKGSEVPRASLSSARMHTARRGHSTVRESRLIVILQHDIHNCCPESHFIVRISFVFVYWFASESTVTPTSNGPSVALARHTNLYAECMQLVCIKAMSNTRVGSRGRERERLMLHHLGLDRDDHKFIAIPIYRMTHSDIALHPTRQRTSSICTSRNPSQI
jgi:hypothetical protein